MADPADIRGSYNLDDVDEEFRHPCGDSGRCLQRTAENVGSFAIKELENIMKQFGWKSGLHRWLFVALYTIYLTIER
jgi:hypothetical protein